ncbi:MAG: amidohydrolase [Clostridia bacterium]|nr:amidohydrolase [Clostridia bacterium]MBR4087367.1 amidohydrolase [Clostridia bacterium]
MKIIDFHTHIYPDAIADKATAAIRKFYEFGEGGFHGSAQVLLERGKAGGIAEFAVLPVALHPDQVRKINENIIHEASAHQEFHGFGTVHAAMDGLMEEAEFIFRAGLHGIKLHPDTQLFNIDDERLLPVYDYMQGKLPLITHTGDHRYDYSHPRRLKRVMDLFPRLEVIAPHFGGWSVFDEAVALLGPKNCWVDLSSSRQMMSTEQFLHYIDAYGADRVLFGSDFPIWDPAEEAAFFMQLPLKDADKEKIAYKNAEKILKKG